MIPTLPTSVRSSARTRSTRPSSAIAMLFSNSTDSTEKSARDGRSRARTAALFMDRRRFVPSIFLPLAGVLSGNYYWRNSPAMAETTKSADEVAQLLHVIPTFTLVDAEGVPYMVVGEDARVTGYFFTTYGEAERILTLARSGEDRDNPWRQARISTVPLDVAVTLSLKAGNGNIRNFFQVAPAASDILDALEVTGKDDLADGKVPLFYFANFTTAGTEDVPVYFQRDQLIQDFKSQSKLAVDDELPPVQVTELFSVLTAMVQSSNDDLNHIVFVAPPESRQRAQECQRRGGKKPPFVLGQRNIIL